MQRSLHVDLDVGPFVDHVRPATIWLGLASFFVGAIGVGATLSSSGAGAGPSPAAGLALLALGVAYVGVGLLAPPTASRYDPEIDLPNWGRILVALLSGVCLVAGVLSLSLAL